MLQLLFLSTVLFLSNAFGIFKWRPSLSMRHFLDSKNGSLSSRLLICTSEECKMNSSAVEEVLQSFEGPTFKYIPYPANWNRYFVSWYNIAYTRLPSLAQSRHRLLLSSVRNSMDDGLGHMFFMYNFEVALATKLNLTLTHRHSTYESLTRDDEYTVDNFFGWGRGEIPRENIWEDCAMSVSYYKQPSGTKKCLTCESLKKNGTFGLQRVVTLPSFLVYNCTSRHGWSTRCDTSLHNVLTQNTQSHTIFQVPPGACDFAGSNRNTSRTGPWFRYKYWNLHGRQVGGLWPKGFWRQRKKSLPFDERHLNIAAHVRRGDFFTDRRRQMLSDRVYARAIADVVDIIDSMNGTFARAHAIVHIYSEGRRRSKLGETTHDVDGMDKTYYNEKQEPRSAAQWARAIKRMRRSDGRLRNRLRKELEVQLHISEDTLNSMHEMIAADVFMGSASSMSSGPLYTLSRGVRLLISHPPQQGDPLFAQYDSKAGRLIHPEEFFKAWKIYEAGNGHSLLDAMQR